MKSALRRFLEPGLLAAAEVLSDLRNGSPRGITEAFLTDPALTAPVGATLAVPKGSFATRWHFGAWLYRELNRPLADSSHLRDPGFWTWLAFRLFDHLRPPGTKVYEDARYILLEDDYRKRYRHLVAGPFLVFSLHESEPHIVRGILSTAVHAPGDVYEQFASRQELITSSAVVSAVNRMYFDERSDGLRRGASANARRLAEVLMQFDVTYDFPSLPSERLIALLPREFNRFLSTPRSL